MAANRKIFPVETGFVISENDVWLPGSYDTRETALAAFDLEDRVLQTIQDRKNNEAPGGVGGVITMADLPVGRVKHAR